MKINKSFYILSFLSLSFIILFVKLSLWQFNRATEKKETLHRIQEAIYLSNNAIQVNDSKAINTNKLEAYSLVTLKGYFDNKSSLILSNQYHEHQLGYHLITPFIMANADPQNKAILIDRGFLTSEQVQLFNKNMQHYNKLNTIIVKGIVKSSNSGQFILGDNVLKNRILNNLPEIQKIDLNDAKLKSLFNYPIYEKYLNLLSPTSEGYILDWQWTNITPEKHKGYAITWLLLAITVILLYSYVCYISIKNK